MSIHLPDLRSSHLDRHDIIADKPSVRVSEAGLIGNGRMGVAVLARPDAVQLLFGHNSVWDTRIASIPEEVYGTFDHFWEKHKAGEKGDDAAAAWTQEYSKKTMAGYDEKFPRPFACGTLVLGFDRRKLEVLGHRVRLADGVCQVNFLLSDGILGRLEVIISPSNDRLWVRTFREDGHRLDGILDRIEWISEAGGEPAFKCDRSRVSIQHLVPTRLEGNIPPKVVRLTARIAGTFNVDVTERVQRIKTESGVDPKKLAEEPNSLGSKIPPVLRNVEWTGPDRLCVEMHCGDSDLVSRESGNVPEPREDAVEEALEAARDHWTQFWGRSQ